MGSIITHILHAKVSVLYIDSKERGLSRILEGEVSYKVGTEHWSGKSFIHS